LFPIGKWSNESRKDLKKSINELAEKINPKNNKDTDVSLKAFKIGIPLVKESLRYYLN
jgi:hypothetical protein